MPVIARTQGGPGAGKTRRGLEQMEMVFEKGIAHPLHAGYVSFTRAARKEAADRAAAKFGIKASDLEKEGYFRTLHSIAYRCLRVQNGDLLTGTADDNKWLKDALQDDRVSMTHVDSDDDYLALPAVQGPAGLALALWDVARNRQTSLYNVWEALYSLDARLPDWEDLLDIATRYEAAKRRDKRLDFADLLMRFAGRRWTGDHDDPFEQVHPDGVVPLLPVWWHDEMQDCSYLTSLVFKRLIQPSQYVYLLGDRWQEIYSWAGADGTIFSEWPVSKEEELPTSYRCPQAILDYSYQVIAGCAGAGVRKGFKSTRPGGTIEYTDVEEALGSLHPGEDVLVLARTNAYAKEAGEYLDSVLTPWRPTKGGGRWTAPARAAGIRALVDLQEGRAIDGEAIRRLLDLLPSRADGATLFLSGTKKWFEDEDHRKTILPHNLTEFEMVGGTETFRELVASGAWVDLLDAKCRPLAQAALEKGTKVLDPPTIRVGTAHSAKGAQAAHVVAINRIPYPTKKSIETVEGMEEECRVWYTVVSRASEKLTIADGRNEGFLS